MNISIENVMILLAATLSVIAILSILIYHIVKRYQNIEIRFSPEAISAFRVFLQPCRDYCRLVELGEPPIGICYLYEPTNPSEKYSEINEISKHLRPTKTYLKEFYHKDTDIFWWPYYETGGKNGRLAYCKWVIKTFGNK